MQKPTSAAGGQRRNLGYSSAIVTLSIVLAAASLGIAAIARPAFHNFEFNFYAILSFLPLTVNVLIVVLIMRLRTQSEETVWFVLYLCGLSIACLGEGLQRMSAVPEGAMFWYHLNGIGYTIMPISYYLFALAYIRPLRSQSALLLPSMITSAAITLFFFTGTDLFFSLNTADWFKEPWGYNTPTTELFPLLLVWIEVPLIVALVTFIRFGRSVSNDLLKRQARLYVWAVLVPLVGGSITDGLLPAIGINNIVPTSLFLSTCTSVIAFIGLRRYRAFQVNPAAFAEEVIDGMHEAVIVTDADYRIRFMNPEAERLLGETYAQLSGSPLPESFDQNSWQTVLGRFGRSDADAVEKEPDELTIRNKSGTTVPVNVYASRLDTGNERESHIFIITDISDITASYRKLKESAERITSQNQQLQENDATMKQLLHEAQDLQEQLRREKANIEYTVRVRTAELREARDKLKASDQMKSEFIMLSSHNLRTPLAIMQSSVELLAKDNNTLTPQQKQMIASLTSSTERLGEFVEDLLTIATLESGDELRLVPTPLDEIVSPLVDETEEMTRSKGLRFESPAHRPEIMVNANAMRLRGAIRNILHNAVHYTDNGEISFRIMVHGGRVRLAVEDTGIGIKPDEIPRLFTKFHRAGDPLIADHVGGGIGLYLAKLVVEEHGGQIIVDSTYGKGSSFWIELPLASPVKPEAVEIENISDTTT